MNITNSKKLYLIDGSGFIFRAYHALPPLTRPDGTPVGTVLGFTNMLVKFIADIKAHKIAVVFDVARRTFRNDLYPDYKTTRPETPPDLIPQFFLIRQACHAFGVPILEYQNYEADDVIATYAKRAAVQGFQVVIVSSDKDLMQLVNDTHIVMFDHMKNREIGVAQVQEKFGVLPPQVLDVLALMGDSSDNVPGVPGIGPKTAAELIGKYGNLENLLNHLDEIKQEKRRETLKDHAENARLSKKLITLCDNVSLDRSIDTLNIAPLDPNSYKPFLEQQGFKSLLNRIQTAETKEPIEVKKPLDHSYAMILDPKDLKPWIDKAYNQGWIVLDTETTSLNAMDAELVGISLSTEPGKACYIPVGHQLTLEDQYQANKQDILNLLTPLFQDPSILKIGHNIKYDMLVLKNQGIDMTSVGDTMLMSYVLSPGRHGLDELAKNHFDHHMIAFKDVVGSGSSQKTLDQVSLKAATDYAAEDADYTCRLYQLLSPQLRQNHVLSVYETIDRPLISVLVQMEFDGILVDKTLLKSLSLEFETQMKKLEQQIFDHVGHPFNLASPKQLGEVLFGELSLNPVKKTKTGAHGTGADILEKLAAEGHTVVQKILDWRQLAKLRSTYAEALPQSISHKDGRVHTSYAMAVTNTGRLSSSDPNLQNIPIRTEMGRKIRQAIIPRDGCELVSMDYSQIELRLLAHFADIEALKEAFHHGKDIHAITASQVFGIPLDQVTPDLRRKAKAINFGIIYGMSSYGLGQQLGISNEDAASYIKSYEAQYPGIFDYMKKIKEFARTHGYVTTLFGRKCYVPGILSKNFSERGFAERQAINAPLQGTAADIIKRAMIQVQKAILDQKFQAKMLLQVHDELVFEVPHGELEQFTSVAKNIMEHAATVTVPLIVGVGVGPNWDAAH